MRLAPLLFVLLPNVVLAVDYPVGDVADLKRIEKQLRPGDRVILRDGEWRDVELKCSAEGSVDQPVTFTAQTPGGVVMSGTSRLFISGRHVVVSGLHFRAATVPKDLISFRRDTDVLAEDCRLTECAIVDCNSKEAKNYRWVSLYGRRNRVDHCYLAGKTRGSATLGVWITGGGGEHRIDHNHFGHRPPLGVNGGETIQLGDSSTFTQSNGTTVEANLFETCNGEAEIITNKSCDNRYLHNTFRRCEGALTLRAGDRCRVEGNFFLGDEAKRTGGVRVIGEDHVIVNNYFGDLRGVETRAGICFMNGIPNSPPEGYRQVKRTLVAFNTWVNCAELMYIGYPGRSDATLAPSEVTFASNVLGGSKSPLVTVRTAPLGWRVIGNLAHGGDLGWEVPEGVTVFDPKLERDANGILRAIAGSTVRGQAVGAFPAVSVDLDGDTRPAKGRDIGCDQFVANSRHRQPLTAADVGPAWLKPEQRRSQP